MQQARQKTPIGRYTGQAGELFIGGFYRGLSPVSPWDDIQKKTR